MNMSARRVAALSLGISVIGSCLLSAQAPAPPDPWTRIPTATSCYPDDGLVEKIDKAKSEVAADLERQKAANQEMENKLKAIDGLERSKRMQEFMMKDPERAMKVMQEIQAAGAAVNADAKASSDQTLKLEKELPTLSSGFKAAVDKAVAPVRAEQDAFLKAKGVSLSEVGGGFATTADAQHYSELIKKENGEYEKVCAAFYGPMGGFGRWLSGYKEAQLKMVDAMAASDRGVSLNMQMVGIPGTYRPTAAFEAVQHYLDSLFQVYRNRIVKRDSSRLLPK